MGRNKISIKRLIIAGSRSITDLREVVLALHESRFEPEEIVSGRARGVDRLGETLAEEMGLGLKRFPAKWREGGVFNPAAGYARNEEMAEYAAENGDGALLAVWDGGSGGTAHMIETARAYGLKLHIYFVRG